MISEVFFMYCGEDRTFGGRTSCRCSYRHGRAGNGAAVKIDATTNTSTVGKARESVLRYLKEYPDDAPICWTFGYTEIDPTKRPQPKRKGVR